MGIVGELKVFATETVQIERGILLHLPQRSKFCLCLPVRIC